MGGHPLALGSWWSYAEADALLVGVVVAAVAIFAAGYLGRRGKLALRPSPARGVRAIGKAKRS